MSVFISGANGYLAQHIISLLLNERYKVIGSVRSQERADELSKQFNDPNLSLVVVGDISNPNAFDKTFQTYGKEIKYVLHTASPFHYNVTDVEEDLIKPAYNGTVGILRSIQRYAADTVERVVITSSYAAVVDPAKAQDESVVFNEDSWNPGKWGQGEQNAKNGYRASKKIAEEAAWKFLEENGDKVKFKLTTVNPVLIFGPQAFNNAVTRRLNTSCEILNLLIHLPRDSEVPMIGGRFIDVRDVAKAHLLAFQKEETAGQRLLMAESSFNAHDILKYLRADFPILRDELPDSNPVCCIEGMELGARLDNTRTRKLLGFKFIQLRQSVRDTCKQILEYEGKL